MKSIKTHLVGNFMIVVLVSVIIFEALLIGFVKRYYYNSLEVILTNQIKVSSDFYTRYFSSTSLEDNVLDNVDVFWKQTSAEVQIIDLSGKVLMDSIGVMPKEKIEATDYKKALIGQKGKLIGKVDYDSSNVMAISYPLRSDSNIVGVLRFITSLKEVDKGISKISIVFLIIGTIVILIAMMVSFILANSIINPIKEVTKVAEKMASGNLNVRSKKISDDEVGKLSDTLNFMAEEILKKEQLKNEFISSVSHELRTPLTAIKGWAYTLNSVEIEEKDLLKSGLDVIEEESERLTTMLEELLDFSKFISNNVTLNKELVQLSELAAYLETYLKPRASRENINFVVEHTEGLPPIYIDKNRIKQVLLNVLDNAFKFTDSGGSVHLNAELEKDSVTICITDTGCGIGKDELPKVKEKFYKGKSSKSKNGIGLSICDEIITLHHGKFDIESKLYEGTKVYIKLPINLI